MLPRSFAPAMNMRYVSRTSRVLPCQAVAVPRRVFSSKRFFGHTSSVSNGNGRPQPRLYGIRAEAQPPPNKPLPSSGVTGFVLERGVYQFLSVLLTALSVAIVGATPWMAEKILGVSLLPQAEYIYRLHGIFMLNSAAISHSLLSFVVEDRLDAPECKRLSLALAISFAAVAAPKIYFLSLGNAMPTLGRWMTTAVQLLPSVAFFRLYGMRTLKDIIPGVVSGVDSVLHARNIKSAVYSLLTVSIMGLAFIGIVTPATSASLTMSASVDTFARYLIRTTASLAFLMAITCFTLKEAADQDCLGSKTFKNMNTAMMLIGVACIGNAIYMDRKIGAGVGTVSLQSKFGGIALVAICASLSLLSAYNAITAKKE